MNLQQLRYVITVAKFGTFREAARQLYMAQSSLSSSIKDLEEEYNIQIFARSKKGIEMTCRRGTLFGICGTDRRTGGSVG